MHRLQSAKANKKTIVNTNRHSECLRGHWQITVRSEFKLKSRYFNCFRSRNVAGGTDAIPFRLKSSICTLFSASKLLESNFCIIFDDKFNTFNSPTSRNAIVGKALMKFSDKSSFSRVDAPCIAPQNKLKSNYSDRGAYINRHEIPRTHRCSAESIDFQLNKSLSEPSVQQMIHHQGQRCDCIVDRFVRVTVERRKLPLL